jgi:Mn-dependent DtxR family transcriptional regulator
MIENILGNQTLEKILLSIERYGDCYASGIAKTFDLPLYAVQTQLKRMEMSGVLVSKLYGKVRLYEFNPRYPLLKELRALLQKTFEILPDKEIEKYYMKRTRPRLQNKPL